MKNRHAIAAIGLTLAAGLLHPGAAAHHTGKIYNNLVIMAFDTPEGTQLPPDFAQMLRRNLKIQLGKTNRFREITVVEKGEPVPSNADLDLTGQITRFKKGNSTLRYWTLPGIGATRINAIVEFKERPGGKTLYMTEVSGKVVGGVGGGDSLGATNGLAKDIAKIVTKKMR